MIQNISRVERVVLLLRNVVFSPANQHSLCYSTSSLGCSACRMRRRSGQSCMEEQGSGVKGSSGSSVAAGISVRTGKKVSRSQFSSPSSSSSLASVPKSHRIWGSVEKKIHFYPLSLKVLLMLLMFPRESIKLFSLPASPSALLLFSSDMPVLNPKHSDPCTCCNNIILLKNTLHTAKGLNRAQRLYPFGAS